eukprot:1107276-Prymnesium_polylepis.1
MLLRLRLRLSERKAESTRRRHHGRHGFLVGGEEPQQLVLLAHREQRGLCDRPLGARRRRLSEGGHLQSLNQSGTSARGRLVHVAP